MHSEWKFTVLDGVDKLPACFDCKPRSAFPADSLIWGMPEATAALDRLHRVLKAYYPISDALNKQWTFEREAEERLEQELPQPKAPLTLQEGEEFGRQVNARTAKIKAMAKAEAEAKIAALIAQA